MSIETELNLKMWSNGTDWVIASNLADVKTIITEMYGDEIFDENPDFKIITLDKELTIYTEGTVESRQTKSVLEWIRSEGRGHLFSTEW